MTFDKAVEFVLSHEGGYSNDAHDSGGETKFGISKAAYPGEDIPNLTRERAKELYHRDYWLKCRCGEFPNGFDLLLFDAAVNQGPRKAVMLLQKSLGIHDDGIVGPVTLQVARESGREDIFAFAARRMMQYGLHPQFFRYGLGWSRRLMSALALATE